MNIIKYALFIAALSLTGTDTKAHEWVDYDGTIPDNAVMVNEGVEDRPICRKDDRIGMIQGSKCHSVKRGSRKIENIEDGYQILVVHLSSTHAHEWVDYDDTISDEEDLSSEEEECVFCSKLANEGSGCYTQAEYEALAVEAVNIGIRLAAEHLHEALGVKVRNDPRWPMKIYLTDISEEEFLNHTIYGFVEEWGASEIHYERSQGLVLDRQEYMSSICASGAADEAGLCLEDDYVGLNHSREEDEDSGCYTQAEYEALAVEAVDTGIRLAAEYLREALSQATQARTYIKNKTLSCCEEELLPESVYETTFGIRGHGVSDVVEVYKRRKEYMEGICASGLVADDRLGNCVE